MRVWLILIDLHATAYHTGHGNKVTKSPKDGPWVAYLLVLVSG